LLTIAANVQRREFSIEEEFRKERWNLFLVVVSYGVLLKERKKRKRKSIMWE
jgi:hypothetical protein